MKQAKNKPEYLWTHYYGSLKEVRLNYAENGDYDGYFYGTYEVIFDAPIKELPKNKFWKTLKDAVAGTMAEVKQDIGKKESLLAWLKQQIESVENELDELKQTTAESLQSHACHRWK